MHLTHVVGDGAGIDHFKVHREDKVVRQRLGFTRSTAVNMRQAKRSSRPKRR